MAVIDLIRWRPGIGDPSFMGWFTVIAYVAAGAASAVAALRSPALHDAAKNPRLLWGSVSALMLLLAVNKQLDIQSLFTDIGRAIAKSQGWYGQRRTVQFWATIGIGAAGSIAFLALFLLLKDQFRQHWLLLTGIVFLLTFIVMRAASFHHFETILDLRLRSVRLNWAFELLGIGCVGLSGTLAVLSGKSFPKEIV
jgi:hypothetical protein